MYPIENNRSKSNHKKRSSAAKTTPIAVNSYNALFVRSMVWSIVAVIFVVFIFVLLIWIYYSNYMEMYKPFINLKTDNQPLSLYESLKLLIYLKTHR